MHETCHTKIPRLPCYFRWIDLYVNDYFRLLCKQDVFGVNDDTVTACSIVTNGGCVWKWGYGITGRSHTVKWYEGRVAAARHETCEELASKRFVR